MQNGKPCLDCQVVKPLNDFSPAKKRSDGHAPYCRPCMRARVAASRARARAGEPSARAKAQSAPPGQKWCPDCQAYLPHDAFGRNRSSADGLTGYCKVCHRERGYASRARNGGSRNYHLRRRYGISAAEYDALLEEQGGLCAVCKERPAEHVDHDHVFGHVRGLLCSCCNQGLGNFRDQLQHVQAAADYLERTTWTRHPVTTGVYQLTSPRPGAAASPSSSGLPRLISSRRG